MDSKKDLEKYFKQLQTQIEQAQKNNQPIDDYIKKQLRILEIAHDEFVKKADEAGHTLETNPRRSEIEIKQYSAMKQLAKKIGLSQEKYDNAIKNIRIKVLGEDITKTYFD